MSCKPDVFFSRQKAPKFTGVGGGCFPLRTASTVMIWDEPLHSTRSEGEAPLNVLPESLFLKVSVHDQR